jgi:biopolymer transport protein ExbD
MAEMITGNGRKPRTLTSKSVKKSTRPDLTPMVDLGFLLITFFIFSTVLAAPKSMKLRIPHDKGITDVKRDRLLVLIADSNGACYSYEARDPKGSFQKHRSSHAESIRQTILRKKEMLRQSYPADSYAMVSLKFLPGSSYGAFATLLDEVKINGIGYYNIDGVRPPELLLLKAMK